MIGWDFVRRVTGLNLQGFLFGQFPARRGRCGWGAVTVVIVVVVGAAFSGLVDGYRRQQSARGFFRSVRVRRVVKAHRGIAGGARQQRSRTPRPTQTAAAVRRMVRVERHQGAIERGKDRRHPAAVPHGNVRAPPVEGHVVGRLPLVVVRIAGLRWVQGVRQLNGGVDAIGDLAPERIQQFQVHC